MTGIHYRSNRTGLVLVDPYNDWLSEQGKVWPRVKEVAEAVGLHQHLRELLAAVRAAGITVFIAPHRRWRPGDIDGAYSKELMHAAHELAGPLYANAIMTTGEVAAVLAGS